MKTAYSILEVAKSAGYNTWWISNQVKFSAWDTPTSVIASSANHEIWLNGSVGKTYSTQYYDERVIQKVAELQTDNSDNLFIVCHLMGSHVFYQDRYPKQFEKFPVTSKRTVKSITAYDNSIYYTDYVLKSLYKTLQQRPNFKGLIYLSDHGEELEQQKGHNASKFTWQMARIPLVMFFSNSFMQHSESIYLTLLRNKELYWTNDLLYNLLVPILGIKNAPESPEQFNLGSEYYKMNKTELKTLHGKFSLSEEKNK